MISRILRGVTLTALLLAGITLTACSFGDGRDSLTKSSDDRLSDIVLTGATFDSSFSSDELVYDAELISNESPTVTIDAEKNQSGQSVTIDDVITETASVTVSSASTSCSIKVTSEDGTNHRTYTVNIRRKTALSSDAFLSSLSVTGYDLSFSKTNYSYSVTVPAATSSAVINFTANSSTSTVYFNETLTTASSQTVSLNPGSNKFAVRLVSEDKSAGNEYVLYIVRTSTYDTSLKNLVVSSGTLSPAFSSTALSYTATTSESSFTVKPTASDSSASITVNGASVSSGSNSSSISFSAANEVKTAEIIVSLGGTSTTYSVAMTYKPDIIEGNAYLSGLATSAGTLSFGKQTFAYSGYTVESTVESVTVTPTAEDSSASITVNGAAAVSGSAATVALTKGEDNIIDITVTDGTKSHTYLIMVTRKGEGSTITGVWVNAYIPASWNWPGVYVYYWTDSNTTLSAWATSPKMTAAGSDWYSYNVTEVSTVNAIIKDATGNPTVAANKSGDMKGLTGDVYISCTNSTWSATTTRPSGAPSHQGWSAPAKPVITFSPDGGDVVKGNAVTISASANATGATIASSGYLVDGVKVSGLGSLTITANANVVAYAKNSIGGASISASKSFTAISATKPTISMTPASGSFTDTQTVTVTTTNADKKYSSIDGGAWTAFTGATLTIGGSTAAGSSVTLQIKAVNSSTSEETISAICSYKKITPYTASFSWNNASVYFVMTDRFYNGDSSNDASYGRVKVDATGKNIGTFHGGDLKGLTEKLNAGYFTDLGVNAIWITAPYEQMHGWCGGGSSGDFAHYAYHGYYALDYTEMDQNMGTVAELREFVTTAHKNGIRVIFDIVMNHAGYNTLKDMEQYGFGAYTSAISSSWTPGSGQTWHSHHSSIDYSSSSAAAGWAKWWGVNWIRAGIAGYTAGGGDDLTKCLDNLPDYKTESTSSVAMSPLLVTKWNMETAGFESWINPSASSLRNTSSSVVPAEFLIKSLAAWVREFGIDGFRCDTAKHVELSRWKELKTACAAALGDWRNDSSKSAGDPAKSWSDAFWMTGEAWGHGVGRSSYYDNGFDSMINFSFPKDGSTSSIGSTWQSYSDQINKTRTFNALSYVSSHDTGLSRSNGAGLATCLMLSPGGIQVFYGDESARPFGATGSDPYQGTRSDMNWSSIDTTLLAHWKKVGTFRGEHVAVGAGVQTSLGSDTYGRTFTTAGGETDNVIIKINASGSTSVNVTGFFDNGVKVRNHYDGTTAIVANNAVTFTASNGVILIESAD